MHRALLDILVDPVSGAQLRLEKDDGIDPVDEGILVSSTGGRFPIVRGVPRFVGDQAYASSFGLQWNRFARVQLDSATGRQYSRRRFDSEVGWGRDELSGQWVVDAGCGSGRFAEVAAGYGAEVLAVDVSSAVEAIQTNLGHLPNVHVVQADARALPFQRHAVRHLYSLGVLQHTPDPGAAARALVQFLPEGGKFALTIYGRRPWTRLYSKYWIRPLTRRLPPSALLGAIERAMPVLFPLTTVLFRAPSLGRVFQFAIPVATYVDRRDLPREIRYEEAILDTFDMLSPQFDQPMTVPEVERALSGVAESLSFVSRVPIIVRGVRVLSERSVC